MKISKVVIDNLNGGWINDFSKGSASSPQTKANTYYTGMFNPFKPNYLGQMSNAFAENPTTLSCSELPVNATVAKDSSGVVKGFFMLKDGIIKELDLATSWAGTATNWTAPAGCTLDEYKDIWKHVVPITGVEALMFTYQTATNAYVGYAPVASIASRVDTYKTLTNLSVPHVGCLSVNSQSYVTDKNILWAYDPITGTWSSVNCGIGITLKSVCDYGNYVAAVGDNGTTSWLFLWTGTSATVPNYKYEIRDTNVTAVVNEGGTLRVFTYGKNGTTKVKTFSGTGFDEEADFEIPTSICPAPTHGMVDVWMNQIVWTGNGGDVWTFGSPRKNEIDSGAHKVGKLTTSLLTQVQGCVKNLYGNNLYVGMKNGANNYVYNVKPDESYASNLTSNIRTALYSVPRNSTIERIQVYFSKYTVPGTSASGSSLNIGLYKDYETTDWLNFSLPTNAGASSSELSYFPIVKSIPEVDNFYLDIDFTGIVTIRKIVVTFSYEENDL